MLRRQADTASELREIIRMLAKQTAFTKRRARSVLVASIANLLMGFSALAVFVTIGRELEASTKLILLFSVLATTIPALFFIFLFDQQKKHGDIVFEEASDYYEWLVSKSRPGKEQEQDRSRDRLNPMILRLRVSFREYTGSCDLPLMPGKQGIGGYTMMNFMALFIIILALVVQ